MNETGYHVRVLKVEVVMGTKYVGWDDACEMAAILFMISPWYVRWGGAGREGRGGGREVWIGKE